MYICRDIVYIFYINMTTWAIVIEDTVIIAAYLDNLNITSFI